MKKMLLLMVSAAILVLPFAGPAAADDTQTCEVGVEVIEQPGVDPNPKDPSVETGTYRPYTNCLEEPPIVRDPICLNKPPVCI